MLQPLWSVTNAPLLKQVARFAERRQEVLAGNIANIDTPGYRMREMPVAEFRKALTRAVERIREGESDLLFAPPAKGGLGGVLPSSTSLLNSTPPYLSLETGGEENSLDSLFPESLFRASTPLEQPGITFQDANNRSIEHQFLEMTKNTLWQNFSLELLRGQYDQLQAVIAERP